MFSGIVSEIGTVVSLSSRPPREDPPVAEAYRKPRDLASVTLTILAPKTAHRLKLGSSVAVNGVCTTVEKIIPSLSSRFNHSSSRPPEEDPPLAEAYQKLRDLAFTVRLMPITLKLTTLGSLKVGDLVNLEPALRVGDELGGHFVIGHVDGIGIITSSLLSSRAKSPPRADPPLAERDLGTLVAIKVPPILIRFIVPRGSIAVDGVSLTVVNKRANVFMVSLVDYTIKHTTLGNKKVGDAVNIEVDIFARYSSLSR